MKKSTLIFSFGILLAVGLASNLVNNLLSQSWNTNAAIYQDNAVASVAQDEYNHEAFEGVKIQLHPGTKITEDGSSNLKTEHTSLSSLNRCKSLVYRTLKNLPAAPVSYLKTLTLSFDENARRGLGGGSTIVLRCSNVSDRELIGVLTHEIGHVMDTGVLQGNSFAGTSEFVDGSSPIYKNDPSLDFYRISFIDSNNLSETADELDFVSGYALTDPFEDFAESYAYYILHGKEFRELAKSNAALNKKYEFLKGRIFTGKEYDNGDMGNVSILERHYDVTVLSYDLKKFFVS